jgi:hypothetical protein
MPISKVKTGSISDSAVTSAKIQDGSIVNADINACAAIASSKLTVDTSALESDINTNKFNISLLGFKMAVNEGLTVFNLVDGVVDEFNDESGTDEAEGSNDNYDATCDFYQNAPAIISGCVSAGFSTTAITEPDTSTAGTNPTEGCGTLGSFTVPTGMTSLTMKVWGAGGSSSWDTPGYGDYNNTGGGGGFATGTLAVTGSQTLYISAGEGGYGVINPTPNPGGAPTAEFFGAGPGSSGGAGIAGVFSVNSSTPGCHSAPGVYMVAGGGGGSGGFASGLDGGVGGGLTAGAGCGAGTSAQTSNNGPVGCSGGGGDQEQGGQSLSTGPALSASSNYKRCIFTRWFRKLWWCWRRILWWWCWRKTRKSITRR